MYFVIWFFLLLGMWIYHKVNRATSMSLTAYLLYQHQHQHQQEQQPLEQQSDLHTSLLARINEEGRADPSSNSSDSQGSASADFHHSHHHQQHEQVVKMLCKKYRFLRAFEFLMLFSYETLTEQALQLINCIGIGSCGRVLAEYPDVSCSSSDYNPLKGIAILILVYAVLFPALLWLGLYRHVRSRRRLRRDLTAIGASAGDNGNNISNAVIIHNEKDKDNDGDTDDDDDDDDPVAEARYGVFYDHYRNKFWWWEVQVKGLL